MPKDLVVKVGEYEKDGETKGRYLNIGVMLENENGPYILLDPSVNLAGVMIKQRVLNPQKAGDSVMVSIFDREKKQASQQHDPGDGGPNDDIPF